MVKEPTRSLRVDKRTKMYEDLALNKPKHVQLGSEEFGKGQLLCDTPPRWI